MSKSGSARLQFSLVGKVEKTGNVGTMKLPISEKLDWNFTDGGGALQFNRALKVVGTATAVAAVACDLNGTTLDDFGDATDMTEVVAVIVKHKTPGGGQLLVGGGANDIADWATSRKFRPGPDGNTPGVGIWLAPDANGSPVAPGTADKLTVATSAGSIDFELVILGRGP